jgi:hypothetical protein
MERQFIGNIPEYLIIIKREIYMNPKFEWDIYDKFNYIVHYMRYRKNQVIHKLTGKDYWAMPKVVGGKWLISTAEANQIIGEAILKGEAFWVGRYGGTEMNMIYSELLYRQHPEKDNRKDAVDKLCMLSGFFPSDVDKGRQFVDLMLEECVELDLQGAWRRYMENYMYIKYQNRHAILTQLINLEPWNMYKCHKSHGVKPWSAALKGKKVLVIHPFAETIERQYNQNRKKIFSRIFDADDILPKFELHTIKAVQSLADEDTTRYSDWFEALEWMKEECPLAAEVKRMGKVVVHLGGATQLLFGIIGSRWEQENPKFCQDVVNEYWVRPSVGEHIKSADKIENACYW